MPKIMGLNVVGVLVGTVAFYMIGFVWYGVLFADAWMAASGITEADANPTLITWIGGILITLLQVIGLGLILNWRGVSGIGTAVTTALTLGILIAVPFAAYAYVYQPQGSLTLLLIDGSHLLVGWIVAAVGLSLFK